MSEYFNQKGDSTYVPNVIGSGQKTVTTAGTQVQLTSTATPILSVCIKALSTNTGSIYVGTSTVSSSDGFILAASGSVSMEINDLSAVWIDSSADGEGVSYIYIARG